MNLDNYTVKDATHLLQCCHAIGRSRSVYDMHCLPLGKSKSGKVKVLVFGERNWRNKEHIKRIRYVAPNKLSAKETQTTTI